MPSASRLSPALVRPKFDTVIL